MALYELLTSTELVVPFGQVILYVTLISLCMVFYKLKLALIISYLFVLHWGFVLNKASFISKLGEVKYGTYVYGLIGMIIFVLSVISFFRKEE